MGLWGFITGHDAFSDGSRAAEEWFKQGGGTDVSQETIEKIWFDVQTGRPEEFVEGFMSEVNLEERNAANREKGGFIGWLFGG